MELIGTVVVHEIYNVLNQNEDFDHKRFVAALRQLPKLPYEEDACILHATMNIGLPASRQKVGKAPELVGGDPDIER